MVDTLTPGLTVLPLDGETDIWPTLALASLDTIVEDADGQQWTRHGTWWAGADGARLTSVQLGDRGPLTVISVHVCETWVDLTEFASRYVKSMCVSCGMTKGDGEMSHWTDQPQVQVNHVHDTMRLTDFLAARMDEEEAMAVHAKQFRQVLPEDIAPDVGAIIMDPDRFLDEVNAKRSMITRARTYASAVADQERRGDDTSLMLPRWSEWDMAMRYLGRIYAKHPDYRKEWRA